MSWKTALHGNVNKFTNVDLVLQVFNELHGDSWSSLQALRDCIGDIQEDRNNDIMEAEMDSQRGSADTGEVLPTLLQVPYASEVAKHCSRDVACIGCMTGALQWMT